MHNAEDLEDSEAMENMDKFFYLDIPVDEESFDGDIADIKEGKFVSFRYVAGTNPKHAKISLFIFHFVLLLLVFIVLWYFLCLTNGKYLPLETT